MPESSTEPSLLSTKTIPPEERLVFALDVPGAAQARALVERLQEAVSFYKVGLELFTANGGMVARGAFRAGASVAVVCPPAAEPLRARVSAEVGAGEASVTVRSARAVPPWVAGVDRVAVR